MAKILAFIKRRWILVTVGIVLIIIVTLLFRKGNGGISTVAVARGPVVSLVSVTGTVKPAHIIDLAFSQSGRLSYLGVTVGQKVSEGQILAHLDNADLVAQVAQADANVKTQQAKLDALVRGTRPEDLAAKAAELQKAQSDLSSYYASAVNVLNDAYAKTDDALHTQLDTFFTNDDTDSPQLTFQSSDLQGSINAEWDRVLAKVAFDKWGSELSALQINAAPDAVYSELQNTQTYLTTVRTLLDQLMAVLNGAGNMSAATLNSYKTYLATARSAINTASTNITNQQQLIDGQKATFAQVQSQYDLLKAGSTKEDVDAQQAQVEQAQANAQYARAQLEKTIIRAAFSGTVTKLPFDEGDTVTANTPVASMIGSGTYQIEADIAETDIARVAIGKTATVTLDAYGPSVTFDAKVAELDLSATMMEGVATYKATLEFTKNDPRILPGLTANVDILSDKRDNVLYIPTRDVMEKDGNNYVNLVVSQKDATTKEVPVTIGLRGSDGRTEIVSGVNEGDLILAE